MSGQAFPLPLPLGPVILFAGVATALFAAWLVDRKHKDADPAPYQSVLAGLMAARLTYALGYLSAYCDFLKVLDVRDRSSMTVPTVCSIAFGSRAVSRSVIAVALASSLSTANGSTPDRAKQTALHSVSSTPSDGKRGDTYAAPPETVTAIVLDQAHPATCFGHGDDRPEGDGHIAAPFMMPVDGASLSSPFGLRLHPGTGQPGEHTGVDLAAPTGTPVNAAASGTVEFTGFDKHGYGRYVILRHAAGYSTWYAHLSKFAAHLRAGMQLRLGQKLGSVGRTGDATGPHLHFEVRYNHEPRDPLPLIRSHIEPIFAADTPAAFQPYIAAVHPALETDVPPSSRATPRTGNRDSMQGHTC